MKKKIFMICSDISDEVPTINMTAEAKWYYIYKINVNKVVEELPFSVLEGMADELGVSGWVDHVPNPMVLEYWAYENGYYLPEMVMEFVTGRWALEVDGKYSYMDLEKYKARRSSEQG